MNKPILHVEVLGENLDTLKTFYGDVFGWELSPIGNDYTVARPAQGPSIGIGAMGPGRNHVTFYVGVPDVELALQKAEQCGGLRAFGPHPLPEGGTFGGFTDPEGHLIGLVNGAS